MANYDAIKKQTDEQAKKKIEEANKIYNDQMAATEQIYNEQIAESDKSFELTYDQANVQRKINERFAKEAVANMGQTNSGYSRNQQAQIRLAYGNAVLKTDLQKTAAANSIRQQLASHKADIEAQKAQNAFSIQNSYDQLAQETYNSQVAAARRYSGSSGGSGSSASEYSALKKFLRNYEYSNKQKAIEISEFLSKYPNDYDFDMLLDIAEMSEEEYESYIFEANTKGGALASAVNGVVNYVKSAGKKLAGNAKK